MSERLRCHMFIGIPASGKSTLANELAPLINAEILSTDKIREELYKDETIQGNWNEIESLLHERLKEYIRQNKQVILDATFAMRPWRLTITQNLLFDKEIEWIGWWFKTPLEICLEWNQLRERKVDDPVIKRFEFKLVLLVSKFISSKKSLIRFFLKQSIVFLFQLFSSKIF